MTRRTRLPGAWLCATVIAATLGVTPALAAAAWTIRPGGAFGARSGPATFKDTATGNTFTCTSMTASGTLKSGSALPGANAGSVPAVGFTNCTSPFGLVHTVFTLRATGLPWHVNLLSYSGGVVTGNVSHMRITVFNPGCSAVIDGTAAAANDGSVKFRYTDRAGALSVLTTGGNLHFYDVSGCAGLFNSGDRATLGATFTLTPKQTITSP